MLNDLPQLDYQTYWPDLTRVGKVCTNAAGWMTTFNQLSDINYLIDCDLAGETRSSFGRTIAVAELTRHRSEPNRQFLVTFSSSPTPSLVTATATMVANLDPRRGLMPGGFQSRSVHVKALDGMTGGVIGGATVRSFRSPEYGVRSGGTYDGSDADCPAFGVSFLSMLLKSTTVSNFLLGYQDPIVIQHTV